MLLLCRVRPASIGCKQGKRPGRAECLGLHRIHDQDKEVVLLEEDLLQIVALVWFQFDKNPHLASIGRLVQPDGFYKTAAYLDRPFQGRGNLQVGKFADHLRITRFNAAQYGWIEAI